MADYGFDVEDIQELNDDALNDLFGGVAATPSVSCDCAV
jgi:hypothetical protein